MSQLVGEAKHGRLPDDYVVPHGDFEAFRRFIIQVMKSIESRDYPRGTTANQISDGYLDRLVAHWTDLGAIPAHMIPGKPPNVTAEFHKRILRSLAYSLQHPKVAVQSGTKREIQAALEVFINAHVAIFGRVDLIPYSAFCVIVAETQEIPDHYGHSAYLADADPRFTAAEQVLERAYRRAVAFPQYAGGCPPSSATETTTPLHPKDQCAEYIALPTLVLKSLTLTATKVPRNFCAHCRSYVTGLVNSYVGLRVIDLANGRIYESKKTSLPDRN
ncbi:hypothetical protein CPC08DRAFT_750502 [Agrocybe pediades]|nr:hypothetical protein CPC08DRAFT_750502 [Agrocybe pediades]